VILYEKNKLAFGSISNSLQSSSLNILNYTSLPILLGEEQYTELNCDSMVLDSEENLFIDCLINKDLSLVQVKNCFQN